MRSRPVRQHLWLLAGVLCSSTLVVAGVSVVGLRAERDDITTLSTVVSPAHDLNARILQTMTNAETGLRGYLATANPALLEPYTGAEQQVGADQSQLRALLADSRLTAADRRTYAQQEVTQDAAIAQWWHYATDARGRAAAGQQADLVTGKAIFDSVRAANGTLAGTVTTHRQALRSGSTHTLNEALVVLLSVTAFAVLVGFLLAGWLSRAVTVPIQRLREVVQRQRDGEGEVRAEEHSGPTEVRDLAVAFNVLATRNAELSAEQAEALNLHQKAAEIGRAIRGTSAAQEAMDVTCARLGPALGVRRVMATTIDETGEITSGAQWHQPDLTDLPDVGEDLVPHLGRIATELWSGGEHLAIDDLLAEDVQLQDWPRLFHRETGATALVLAPVGLGERAIGNLCVVADEGPRHWTSAEVSIVQQTATFLARAIIQAEYDARQADYIARLEHLDRQKTEFLSTVSHELRTPLTSIQGYLELLLEGDMGELTAEQLHTLGVIERNAVRLRGLIEDILVLNRAELGGLWPDTSEVSLRALVSDIAEELRPMADKTAVRLFTETGDDAATVLADRVQLQRALVNVLSNAIKFTPREGTVQLSCGVDPVADEAVVTCRDTGIGIPEADQEHLFNRFFRASNATGKAIPGTGLGLAIVKAIVEAHHGRLALDSVEGEGTTIVLRFPRTEPPTNGEAPHDS